MRHACCPLPCGILLLISEPAHALETVIRDSIGPDSNLTDGLGGVGALIMTAPLGIHRV